MGTRGAFGVIIGEEEKIAYNHFDSYPDGKGIEVLGWLRSVVDEGRLDEIKKLAHKVRVVDENSKPTARDKQKLRSFTNLNVADQSEDDWYCLTREMQGDLGLTLGSGYMLDRSNFPLDSLFCEWAYIVDLDAEVFEVYAGFQKTLPKQGRWKGRPTLAEDTENYIAHLEWCHENDRKPFRKRRAEYKAIEMIASWPLDELPGDDHFLSALGRQEEEAAIA